MDSAGGESSMREESGDRSEMQRFAEEIWQRHLALLGRKERSALLMHPWGGKGSTRMRMEKHRVVEKHMKNLSSVSQDERGMRLMKVFLQMKHEEEKRREEERTAKVAKKKELSAMRKRKKKNNNNKAQHQGTGIPEESGTVASSKSSSELTGKETVQQLLEGMPNKFDILDPDGGDDKGKSAIEEEHMPSDMTNASDRGEGSVTVGSGKSALDKAVISPETEQSVTQAVKKEAYEAALLVGLKSTGGESIMNTVSEEESEKRSVMQPTAPVPDFPSSVQPEYWEIQRAMLHIQEKLTKKRSREMDKEILGLLNGMSNMLDQGGDAGDHEDTNGGTNTTMVQSDNEPADPSATNLITIQDDHVSEMACRQGFLQQLFKDLSDNFDKSMRSAPAIIQQHTPMVGSSDKLVIRQPADPSAAGGSVTRLGHHSLQDDLDHNDMPKMTADEEMADEAESFAEYRSNWEYAWGETCGSFNNMTALSSMQFTYYTPGRIPLDSAASTPATLQIFSIKLAEKAVDLQWPLSVYGVVAVRDVADHNRNFLFYCGRERSQELTQNDPFLRLIGPSRAVVYTEEVKFEIELKVKGTTESQDKALITQGRHSLEVFGHDVYTVCFENCFCKMELCAQVVEGTIQATILGVQVVEGWHWPFKYGARVACSSLAGKIVVTEDNLVTFVTYPASAEIVMVDSKDGATLKGGGGYLHLARNVISVEEQGRLDVDIQAYSKSGVIAARGHVSFPAKFSKITRKKCFLGGVMVVVTVAWSKVVEDKGDLTAPSCLV